MGGWMDYTRMRSRNGLMFRKPDDDPDPYWRGAADDHHNQAALEAIGGYGLEQNRASLRHSLEERHLGLLIGDINRMERDYLNPVYPEPPWATREPGSDPTAQIAATTGVDAEVVRAVLRAFFFGERWC